MKIEEIDLVRLPGPHAERAPHGGSRGSRRRTRGGGQVPESRQGQSIENQVLRGVFGMLERR
jgi:hypothetical protein